jgi:hypothetical protein
VFATLRRAPLVSVGTPRSWLMAMTVVSIAGGALAIPLASERDPLEWTVSHLGVDAGASGIVNVTLVALGLALLALGMSLRRSFATLRSASRLSLRAEASLVAGFVVAGTAVSLTGLFRIDFEPSTTIHNLAAYAAPIALIATLLGGRLAISGLGFRFDALSVAIFASIVAVYVAASSGHVLPYSVMELTCFGLIGVWLWLFESRLRRVVDDLGPS